MTTPLPPILFIGGGNMGGALISGLIAGGSYKPTDVYVCDPGQAQLDSLSAKYAGINVSLTTTPEFVTAATIIVLAVKPGIVPAVCATIAPHIDMKKHIIVSICGGVSISVIHSAISVARDPLCPLHEFTLPIVRVMPNTPALVLSGASGLAKGQFVSDEQLAMVTTIFSAVGSCVTVNEYDLHAVTGVSGSGPAYVIAFVEAMTAGGVAAGLTYPLAYQLALDTLVGTGKMLKESGQHPAVLREMICSPGGTTIAGVHALHKEGMPNALMECVLAATNRSKELAAKAEATKK